MPLAVPSAVAFLPEEVVCALVRGLVFVTTECQLRGSAYFGAVQLVTLYVTSTPTCNTRCGRQMKKGSFAATFPSPVRGPSRKHPQHTPHPLTQIAPNLANSPRNPDPRSIIHICQLSKKSALMELSCFGQTGKEFKKANANISTKILKL